MYQDFCHPSDEESSAVSISSIYNKNNKFYITANTDKIALVYKGKINGSGKWYQFKYPKASKTRFSKISKQDKNITIVGSCRIDDVDFACLYFGTLNHGRWKILDGNSKFLSIVDNIIVGTYDINKSFIYDIDSNKYFNLTLPIDSTEITVYDICYNEDLYHLCGSYVSNDIAKKDGKHRCDDFCNHSKIDYIQYGFTAQFDRGNLTIINFNFYQFKDATNTCFLGITKVDSGYQIVGNASMTDGKLVAFILSKNQYSIVTVPRANNTWARAIYKNIIVGNYSDNNDNNKNYILTF